MSTVYTPPLPMVIGTTYTFPLALTSRADTKEFQTSPTIAAGDFILFRKVSGTWSRVGNIGTDPALIGIDTEVLLFTVLDTELIANTQAIAIKCKDAAGDEWCDLFIHKDCEVAVTVSDGTGVTLASGAITAAVIATGAIDADAIADGAIDAGSIASDAITAAKVADGAIDAATFAAGAINAAAIATGAIDADALAADAGTEIGTAVWASATRTLTQASTSTADTSSTGAIRRTRGDSWSITITGLPDNTGYTSMWFTLKDKKSDADSAARIQIKKNASTLNDGLLYVNGAAASDATKGSITINSTTSITIAVDESITDDMPAPFGGYYDVQTLISGTTNTPESGAFEITEDVTKSIT